MNPNLDSRDLADLTPAFRTQVETLLATCEARKANLRPFFTARGPATQAKLWCQSRTAPQILAQKAKMEAIGAPWLASFLKAEYASTGKQVTNALPGQSWHQWGQAIDCFVVGAQNEAIWDTRHPGYKIYSTEARKMGLESGAFWTKLKDTVHVQAQAAASPLSGGLNSVALDWSQIEKELRKLYLQP